MCKIRTTVTTLNANKLVSTLTVEMIVELMKAVITLMVVVMTVMIMTVMRMMLVGVDMNLKRCGGPVPAWQRCSTG